MRSKTLLLTSLVCALGAGVTFAGDAPSPPSAANLVDQVRREKSAVKRAAIVKALEKMGKDAEEALLGSWKTVDDRTAVDLLLLIERLKTDGARDDLIKATKSRKDVARRVAAGGLGGYPHADTEQALFRLIHDRNLDVATAAIESIQCLKSKTTYKPLLRAIRRYDNEPSGQRFASLLGVARTLLKETHDPEIVRELCRMAAQEEVEHQGVILSIFEVGEKEVCAPILREVLREFVEGDDYDGPGFGEPLRDGSTAEALRPITAAFARIAIKGLGLARDTASSEAMIRALGHPAAEIRLAALQYVRLTLPEVVPVRGEVAPEGFPSLQRRAIKAVMPRLTDRSKVVRKQAHTWLKRETGQRQLAPTFAAWKVWYQAYFNEFEYEEYE